MIQYLPFSLSMYINKPIVSLKEKMYVDSREEKNDSSRKLPLLLLLSYHNLHSAPSEQIPYSALHG